MALPQDALPDTIHVRSFYNTDEKDPNIAFQTKIESSDKKVLRKVGEEIVEQKIWIDVFLIDGMPKTNLGRIIHYYNIRLHQTLYRIARSARNGQLKEKRGVCLRNMVYSFCRSCLSEDY